MTIGGRRAGDAGESTRDWGEIRGAGGLWVFGEGLGGWGGDDGGFWAGDWGREGGLGADFGEIGGVWGRFAVLGAGGG